MQGMTRPGSTREREREANRRFKTRLWGSQVISFTYEQLTDKRAYWGNRCYLCGEITDGFAAGSMARSLDAPPPYKGPRY